MYGSSCFFSRFTSFSNFSVFLMDFQEFVKIPSNIDKYPWEKLKRNCKLFNWEALGSSLQNCYISKKKEGIENAVRLP